MLIVKVVVTLVLDCAGHTIVKWCLTSPQASWCVLIVWITSTIVFVKVSTNVLLVDNVTTHSTEAFAISIDIGLLFLHSHKVSYCVNQWCTDCVLHLRLILSVVTEFLILVTHFLDG